MSQRDTVINIRVKSPTCSELVDNDWNSSQIEFNHWLRTENDVKIGRYCAISINSAGHVTRYMPAEILNSAHGGNDRYIPFFSADF